MLRKKSAGRVAVILLLIIAAALITADYALGGTYLTLRDEEGKLYARYPLSEGQRFTVTFKHSVNQYPLSDIYEIEEGTIYVEECKYAAYGAGVQTELNPGESMTYTDDGSMLVTGIHQVRTNVRYNVGTVYDHILTVNDQEISLRELCGRHAPVYFNYEHLPALVPVWKKH